MAMDTQGIDQMLSVMRATAAKASGRVSETQSRAGGWCGLCSGAAELD